jgi:four helix bundle protein
LPFLFEKLVVYQKSVDVAEKVLVLTDGFPKGTFHLADQLNRAAVSISANIAEGNGRWHAKDRHHFFLIVRGSAFECVPLLELARRKGLVEVAIQEELKRGLDEIGAMLSGLMKSKANQP